MAVDERKRHELHVKLEELLGSDQAATLMEHLPPVGWADVATKRDLDQLSDRLTAFLHAEVNRAMRWSVTTMLSGMGIAFVIARVA